MKKFIFLILSLIAAIEIGNSANLDNKRAFTAIKKDEFSPTNLRLYLQEKKIKHIEIVYAQAILETGEFKSPIFKQNNNLFGMKYVGKSKWARKTTAIGEQYNHAKYIHWKHSVDDYLLWQQMFKRTPIETQEQYFKLLGKRYSESSIYVKVLKQIMKERNLQSK